MTRQLILFSLLLIFPINLAFGEERNYVLTIDEHSFDVIYDLDGELLAMAIDQELDSLLVGIENVKDSGFQIEFANEMITAENNEFAVLVDGFEIDYDIDNKETSTVLTFFLDEGTQEIEIIGTHVIPEFPIGTIPLLVALIAAISILAKYQRTLGNHFV